MKWRVGHKVPRNLYRDDEPIAMLATEEIAAELVRKLNAAESIATLESWKLFPRDHCIFCGHDEYGASPTSSLAHYETCAYLAVKLA